VILVFFIVHISFIIIITMASTHNCARIIPYRCRCFYNKTALLWSFKPSIPRGFSTVSSSCGLSSGSFTAPRCASPAGASQRNVRAVASLDESSSATKSGATLRGLPLPPLRPGSGLTDSTRIIPYRLGKPLEYPRWLEASPDDGSLDPSLSATTSSSSFSLFREERPSTRERRRRPNWEYARREKRNSWDGFRSTDERQVWWFPKKQPMLLERQNSGMSMNTPIISESYIYFPNPDGPGKMVFKYANVGEGYDTLLELCSRHYETEEEPPHLFEVLYETSPRCLYFDLDGNPDKREMEDELFSLLTKYVEQEFEMENLTPVLVRSFDTQKFSCHIIFPEIQFADLEHQSQYVPRLLYHMAEFSEPLAEVVDPNPYSKFQLFRLPWSVKLSLKRGLIKESLFVPKQPFKDDWKTVFAGYTNPAYRRPLPVAKPWEPKRVRRLGFSVGLSDINCLYLEKFLQPEKAGTFEFPVDNLEAFRVGLNLINPLRASHWWSWFRLCGVTYRLMHPVEFNDNTVENARAEEYLQVFLEWSKQYPNYDECENLDMIYRCHGVKRISSGMTLRNVAMFDNPTMEFPQLVREHMDAQKERETQRLRPKTDDFGTRMVREHKEEEVSEGGRESSE